jgi:hypothetical protein
MDDHGGCPIARSSPYSPLSGKKDDGRSKEEYFLGRRVTHRTNLSPGRVTGNPETTCHGSVLSGLPTMGSEPEAVIKTRFGGKQWTQHSV